MKTRTSLITACLVALFLSPKNAQSTNEPTLKLNLQEGFSALIRTVNVKDTLATKAEEILTKDYKKTTSDYEISCHNVDPNGTMEVWQTLKSLTIQYKGTKGDYTYDSNQTDTPTPPQAGPSAAMLGNTIIMRITPNGTITNVKGIEKVIDDMIILSQISPDNSVSFRKMFREYFNAPGHIKLETSLGRYPLKTVSPDDQWQYTFKHQAGHTDYTYTVKSIMQNVDLAKIDIIGNPHLNSDQSTSQGSIKTQAYLDLTTGLILFSHNTSEVYSQTKQGEKISSKFTTLTRLIDKHQNNN